MDAFGPDQRGHPRPQVIQVGGICWFSRQLMMRICIFPVNFSQRSIQEVFSGKPPPKKAPEITK